MQCMLSRMHSMCQVWGQDILFPTFPERSAQALEENKIQEYMLNQPSNEFIESVRNLLEEGSKYPNSCTAF